MLYFGYDPSTRITRKKKNEAKFPPPARAFVDVFPNFVNSSEIEKQKTKQEN